MLDTLATFRCLPKSSQPRFLFLSILRLQRQVKDPVVEETNHDAVRNTRFWMIRRCGFMKDNRDGIDEDGELGSAVHVVADGEGFVGQLHKAGLPVH